MRESISRYAFFLISYRPPINKLWYVTLPRGMAAMIGLFLPNLLATLAVVRNAKRFCHANSDSCEAFSKYGYNAEEGVSDSAWLTLRYLTIFSTPLVLNIFVWTLIYSDLGIRGETFLPALPTNRRNNNCLIGFFQGAVLQGRKHIKLGITFAALMYLSLMVTFAIAGFTHPCFFGEAYDSDNDPCSSDDALPESMQKLTHETKSLIYSVGITTGFFINMILARLLTALDTAYRQSYSAPSPA